MTGTRQRWVELLCLGMGFPLLLALVLTGGGCPERIVFGCAPDKAGPSAAGDRTADPAATVDLAGWRVFIHAATPGFSSIGPEGQAQLLVRTVRNAPTPWALVPAAAPAAPRFYKPQAPPSRA